MTYQIYGVAELHAEKLHALAMKFLREFAAPFDTVMTVLKQTRFDSMPNEQLQARLKLESAVFAEKNKFSVFSHGVRNDILDTIGRNVKTWGDYEPVWDGMHLELFSNEVLPGDPTEALERWNKNRPKPVFEIMTEFRRFPRDGYPYQYYTSSITKFCINAGFCEGSTDADEQAFEKWLASVFTELDINAEWYVTGSKPESASAFFPWDDAEAW
ncbi:MAG: hypothetical protein IJC88_04850 [Oscillospiraceae bacterium]|nr:hypothetical protein [Oscillospiraceae bacterium]